MTERHGAMRNSLDRVQDALGGVVGRVKALMARSSDSFVRNAAIGDMYEVEAARLAVRRALDPEVKAVAEQMIDDHTTSTHHLQAALEMNETKGIEPPPARLDTRRRKMIDHLKLAPDDEFDTTYLDQQILAHQETMTLMTGYSDRGRNAQLRSFAAGTAPVVERHLHHMKELRRQTA